MKAVVALLCALFVASALRYSDSLIDDAYIVFRYADHVVAGDGPVFNAGERVEGFTSPAWLGLIAAARAAGMSGERAVLVWGLLFGVAAIVATWAAAQRVAPGWPAVAAAGVVALDPAHAMWSVHGLETPLAVTLVALAFACSSAWGTGALLGAALWVRPEAPLFVAILTATALARGERERAGKLVLSFAGLALPLLAIRYGYYGTFVPNTFFAKTGGGLARVVWGLGEARRFVVSHLPLVLGCGGVVLAARKLRPPGPVVDAMVCGAAWSAWVVWIGGDAFPGYRFWLPILPVAALVGAWGVSRIRFPVLAACATIVWIVFAARPWVLREYETGMEFTARMKAVGTWLGANAPPEATVALNYVGAVPYLSGLRAIDMLGLTDPVIARTPIAGRFRFPGHARANGGSILDRAPELILMGGVHLAPEPIGKVPAELDSEEQIERDPRYRALYSQVQVPIDTPAGKRWFVFCKRKDVAWTPEGARVTEIPEE